MFMGDAGSQFIGLFVAFFTIKFLWNIGDVTQQNAWISLIVTLTALTPAAADTLTVVINRLMEGKSPMLGGKDHTTHHLVYAGYNDKQVWIIFSGLGFVSFLLSVILIYLAINNTVHLTLLFLGYFVLVFLLLYRNTIKFPRPEEKKKL
jgi:UDP-GlcNAc:undecaprenyl-phosphate GlcNAc-1-phosphate transferase